MTNMPPNPAVALAPAQVPNKRQDDFDMAKLQKALRHDQRRSHVAKNKVAKLTPAEIRSLNHSVGLSKSGSIRSLDSHTSVHRLASTTPPLTPDHHSASRRSQSQRRSSSELPTPPLSPDRERRGSASSARHIHAPKPLSHTQAVHLANVAAHSRPSSQTSYRGVATYRGNEVTRNNSLTMLQHPSQQIVSNPLSQFSRPRQSTATSTTSPSKSSSEHQGGEDVASLAAGKGRTQSVATLGQDLTRGNSPIRPSDSPVSMEDGEAPEKPVNPRTDESDAVPVLHVTPKVGSAPQNDESSESAEPTVKQKLSWRRTLTGSSDPDPDLARLRKEYRRRTLLSPKNGYCLHAIHYNDTKPGPTPQLRDSLRDELPSAKTSVFKEDEQNQAALETEYGQHPAVRPLSQDLGQSKSNDSDSSAPSSSRKGKEREIDHPGVADSDTSSITSSVPSYSRCSCCGRIQKPGGFESDLSPVMENENLRTNFSFEVERMSPNRQRRSSSLTNEGPRRYVPIIPMEVGNETKQARIEPMKETTQPAPRPLSTSTLKAVAVNKLGDIIGPSSMPLAIMPRRKVDPRVVRFASLHRTKDDKLDEQEQSAPAEPVSILAPPAQIQRFGSLYGLRNESQQQQQVHDSDQNIHPPQQNSQSAYQAQQMKQQQRNNSNHPLRVSHNAYYEASLPQTQRNTAAHENSPMTGNDAIEKPLGDSPVATRNADPNSPNSNFSDDGEAMVDLSSFDGSFVHGSISRSATIHRDISPPNTSCGQPNIAPPTNTRFNIALATTSTSSLPAKINTASNNSMNNASIHSAPPGPNAAPSTYPPPLITNLSESSNTTAIYRQHPTTIVKLIPSATVSMSSSPVSSKGPLKLGDWVLPESPSTQSISSRKGSMQSESLGANRGVATA